jgi:8-oxo-dGTP pyrophosphatase MutT (NUDIX family)
MITSRRSANWVFPKGSAIKGLSPSETAAQEALEEAGLHGEVEKEPMGAYLHPRNNDSKSLVEVQLFALRVTRQDDEWQEQEQRFRHWALMPEVNRLLASKEAARIAAALNRRILFSDQNPGSVRINV